MMPHILMIDDDQNILDNTLQLLEFAGFEVSGVDQGSKALQAIEELEPDLILLDLRMRFFNGYEVMAALKDRPWLQNIPIIIISAYADASSIERGLSAGAVHYIVKPFTEDDLYNAVISVLQH